MKTRHLFLDKILLFLIVFLVAANSYAQNQSDIKAIEITDNMKEQLSLSDQHYN